MRMLVLYNHMFLSFENEINLIFYTYYLFVTAYVIDLYVVQV